MPNPREITEEYRKSTIEFIKQHPHRIVDFSHPPIEAQLIAVEQNHNIIENIVNPCIEACIKVYPELSNYLADPTLKCVENPFRIRCGVRTAELRSKFPLISRIFVKFCPLTGKTFD